MQTWRKYFFLILLGCLLGCGKKEQGKSICVDVEGEAKVELCPGGHTEQYGIDNLNRLVIIKCNCGSCMTALVRAPAKPSEGKRKPARHFNQLPDCTKEPMPESCYPHPAGALRVPKNQTFERHGAPIPMGTDGLNDPDAHDVTFAPAPKDVRKDAPAGCIESPGLLTCDAPLKVGPAVKAWTYRVFPDPQQLGEWIEKNCWTVGPGDSQHGWPIDGKVHCLKPGDKAK